jgi:hypothetical protein
MTTHGVSNIVPAPHNSLTNISPDEQARATRSDTFLTLKGFRPQQIQTELSHLYHEQELHLASVEKWHLRFTGGTTDLQDEPSFAWPKKTDLWAQWQSCFVRSHVRHASLSMVTEDPQGNMSPSVTRGNGAGKS